MENDSSTICKFLTVNFEKLAQDLVLKNGIPQMLGHQNGDGLDFEQWATSADVLYLTIEPCNDVFRFYKPRRQTYEAAHLKQQIPSEIMMIHPFSVLDFIVQQSIRVRASRCWCRCSCGHHLSRFGSHGIWRCSCFCCCCCCCCCCCLRNRHGFCRAQFDLRQRLCDPPLLK